MGNSFVDVTFNDNLAVSSAILVKNDSTLKIADTKSLIVGEGGVSIKGTILNLGTGTAGNSISIIPAGEDTSIEIENNGTLQLTSNIEFPNGGTDDVHHCFIEIYPESTGNLKLGENTITTYAAQTGYAIVQIRDNAQATISGGEDAHRAKLVLDANSSNSDLLTIYNNATVTLRGKIDLEVPDGRDCSAIFAGENVTIRFADADVGTINLKGNIVAGKGLQLTLMFTGDAAAVGSVLEWPEGALTATNPTIAVSISDFLKEQGISEFSGKIAAYKTGNKHFDIDLTANTNKNAILEALFGSTVAEKAIENAAIEGLKLVPDGDLVKFDFTNAVSKINNLKDYLGADFNHTFVAGDLFKELSRDANKAQGARSSITNAILTQWLFNDEQVNSRQKVRVLSAFSKPTTEEKNRAALTLVDSIRETAYSKMGQPTSIGKHYNLWASGFGDRAKNSNLKNYRMNFDVFGFTTGVDAWVTDHLLLGTMVGYGKVDAKYKGDLFLSQSDHCDLKSYYGGIYGMWDDFIDDVTAKFSLLGGRGKYRETYTLPYLVLTDFYTSNVKHRSSWVSGNVDCTYKHWEVGGLAFGPWLSLSATSIHQKACHYDEKHYVDAADRLAIETILGVAANYNFTEGNFELALGYKHEFFNKEGGDVNLSLWNDDDEKDTMKYGAAHVRTGRDALVSKAALNMKFGDVGLALAGHGQYGNHFNDIAGSVTLSYSF
ncbi:MAG: autotransporter outer membrane beta-barrel domain-containing protein [Puniceicoccales bacterium]|nr:autotransporter outer membrane beta-barrel domain-containing protein [Puniceicoccales bacterium]